ASGSGVASQLAQLRPIATSSDGQGSPLVTDLSSSELGILTELPRREASGFGISRPRDFAVDVPVGTVQNVVLGTTLCSGAREGSPLSIAVDDLTRHALIVGVTGSGKTTTALHLLNQLWTKHRVPFLVIEPAKSHYRQLLGLPGFEELQVFSPGCGELAPFRINPFAFPPGIHPQTHVSNLYSVFSAAFTLFSPMPYVLERSLCEVYEDRGWDLAGGEHPEVNPETGRPPALSFPTLSDLYDKISQVVNSLGYGERIRMDVTAALQARVDSLRVGQKGLTFDCRFSTPFSAILDRPTVLELSHVGSDEEKSFLMGLLLMRLYEIRESGGDVPHIQHVTLIEEAHRLLRRVSSDVGANSGNPRAQAVETFCNILAEIRAYGEGVIVADQIPTKLAPDVLKNTNLKILHRIVADDDREAMAGAMNLGRPQQRAVTSLSRGEAVVYAEGLDEPALIRVPPPLAHAAVSKQAVESTAAAFYRAHSECLAQFTGCTHCRNVCKHAARVKRSLRSESVFTAAWAVCVACVSDPKSITLTPEWLFAKLARKNLGILNESQSPDGLEWCFLTLVIEIAAWEVHQRFGRTLAQTARLATLMTQFFWAAYGSSHQDETPAAALRAEVLSLTNAIKGPYVGCDLCNRRYLYRGVAEMIARRPNSISRLHKAINSTDSHAAVAALCHRWASVELPNGATTASNELALCVLINFLARTEIRDPVPFISLVFGMGSSPDLS
ncbi:MAG: ATP-binding protein, partial [Lysobacterales bacterium]